MGKSIGQRKVHRYSVEFKLTAVKFSRLPEGAGADGGRRPGDPPFHALAPEEGDKTLGGVAVEVKLVLQSQWSRSRGRRSRFASNLEPDLEPNSPEQPNRLVGRQGLEPWTR